MINKNAIDLVTKAPSVSKKTVEKCIAPIKFHISNAIPNHLPMCLKGLLILIVNSKITPMPNNIISRQIYKTANFFLLITALILGNTFSIIF